MSKKEDQPVRILAGRQTARKSSVVLQRLVWCRLNIRYTNVWSHNSTYTLEAQLYLGNEAVSYKHNKKLIRKSREALEPIYDKWKKQIEADGIECTTA